MSADKNNKPADLTVAAKDVQTKMAAEDGKTLTQRLRDIPESERTQDDKDLLRAAENCHRLKDEEQKSAQVAVYATEKVKPVDLKKEIEGKEVHLHQISIVLPEGKGGDKLTRRDVYIASALKGALTSQFDPTARNAETVADAVVKYADAVIAKLDE